MFNSCVLKLTAFCNLNCSYCYMFNLEDRTFERVPKLMSIHVMKEALKKIEAYAFNRGLEQFSIALHGGEPTLWPVEYFENLAREVERIKRNGIHLDLSIQTNGLHKIDRRLLNIFKNADIRLGVSVDGPKAFHNQYRIRHDGRGSYEQIMSNIGDIFKEGYGDLIAGFLTVANPNIPPKELLEWIKSLPVQKVDILWPIEFNLKNTPWLPGQEEKYVERPYYGEWFSALFKLWWQEDNPSIYIRLFFNVIQLYLGGRNHIDSLVNDMLDMFVINTDGRIEYPDYLRASADESANTGHNILDYNLEILEEEKIFKQLLNLKKYLPSECGFCPHKDLCGGGFLPGRTNEKQHTFSEKSVLCYDHYLFFSTVKHFLSLS